MKKLIFSKAGCAILIFALLLTMFANEVLTQNPFDTQPMVVAGPDHTVVLKSDGTVWAWGDNTYGQLGDGTKTTQYTTSSWVEPTVVERHAYADEQERYPVQVRGLTEVVGVDTGPTHTVALRNKGIIWDWGKDDFPFFWESTSKGPPTSVQVTNLTDAANITTSRMHTMVLKSDGTIWAWGLNDYGQLGDGTISRFEPKPMQVKDLTGVADVVAAGKGYEEYSVALKRDGSVWAWGNNQYGQLGDGSPDEKGTIKVQGLTDVIDVIAASEYTVALKSDGTVWAWGDNKYGQLNDGTMSPRSTPVQVQGLTDVTAIATGEEHTVALKSDGTVWAWGAHWDGTLYAPVQVQGMTDVIDIAAGDEYALAVKSDGTVWTWDTAWHEGSAEDRYAPEQIQVADVVSIDAEFKQVVALTRNGSVWEWTHETIPQKMIGMTDVVNVAAGDGYTVALRSDGTVWTWGSNRFGQLGDGTSVSRHEPVKVQGLTNVVSIVTGGGTREFEGMENDSSHTLALTSDGTVWGWGEIGWDQSDHMYATSSPVQFKGLTDVTAITSGDFHVVAIKSDGTVWTRGHNDYGQLGNDGPVVYTSTPVQVKGLTDVVDVDAASTYLVALKSDGTVWTWGAKREIEVVQDGITAERIYDPSVPVQMQGLTNIVSIAAGDTHTVVIKSDGTVWAWGDNEYGQLGNGSTTDQHAPVQVQGLTDVVGISAGDLHTVAIKSDGTVWAWGDNEYGQLGNGGSEGYSAIPVQVKGPNGVGYLYANKLRH